MSVYDPFAAIYERYCPFRSLLHLPTWADRRRVFERVGAALGPGGRFAWNAFAFDHAIASRLDGQRHTAGSTAGRSRTRAGKFVWVTRKPG